MSTSPIVDLVLVCLSVAHALAALQVYLVRRIVQHAAHKFSWGPHALRAAWARSPAWVGAAGAVGLLAGTVVPELALLSTTAMSVVMGAEAAAAWFRTDSGTTGTTGPWTVALTWASALTALLILLA